jgi:hypothetical protein
MPLRMRQLHMYCKRRDGYVNRPSALIDRVFLSWQCARDATSLAVPLCLTLYLDLCHNGI